MKQSINDRCPLADECERKQCKYADHELDCIYYATNGIGENTIEDQEQIRSVRELAAMEESWNTNYPQDDRPEIEYLPVALLRPHPDNPRKNLGDVSELAESIRKQGIMQNLTVIPCEAEHGAYTVIIGHRRLAAAKAAGLTEVPCIVTGMTQKEQLATMLLENMQRSDLSPYEEANGFQMMLDLGETVETIAKESGFSQTTVRRRVKMMELDQDILKQVSSERQLSLSDFDKLAKIDDLVKRNEVLKTIGTPNFNHEFTEKYRHQETEKSMAVLSKETRRLKAKKLEQSDTWGSNYERVATYKLSEWDRETPLEPDGKGKKLFYFVYADEIRFYIEKERQRAAPVRRSPEEIEREKRIADAWERADSINDTTRAMRRDFVDGLRLTSKNREAMLIGAVKACIVKAVGFASSDTKYIHKRMGMEPSKYYSDDVKQCLDKLTGDFDQLAPAVIYGALGDRDDYNSRTYITGYKKAFPQHSPCEYMDALYGWLTSVGYVMSDEEKAIQDGSHEIFHLDDEPEAKDDEK